MMKLIEPCEKYLKSYVAAREEYIANGVEGYPFADVENCDVFQKFDDYRHERNLKPGYVGADYYWLVEEEHDLFIGEICVRHQLTDALLQYGGHIGYGIRFSEWNKGYGTLMLQLALDKAKDRGIEKVLITCDDDNVGSARVMEHNGLVLENKIENTVDGKQIVTRRYWKDL